MRIPRSVARFNKKVTNPIQRRWAPHLPPYAMVEHVGRKTGTRYSVPVVALTSGERIAIILLYGRDSDWVRNVRAAGSFGVVRRSKHYQVTNARVVPSDSPDIHAGARLPSRVTDSVLIGTMREG